METEFEQVQRILRDMEVPFELTDDSEENQREDEGEEHLNTVIEIRVEGRFIYFFFRRDGTYKEMDFF